MKGVRHDLVRPRVILQVQGEQDVGRLALSIPYGGIVSVFRSLRKRRRHGGSGLFLGRDLFVFHVEIVKPKRRKHMAMARYVDNPRRARR